MPVIALTTNLEPSRAAIPEPPRVTLPDAAGGTEADGFDRILIIAGSENDGEGNFRKLFKHFKAIHARHFNIEKYKVGFDCFYDL